MELVGAVKGTERSCLYRRLPAKGDRPEYLQVIILYLVTEALDASVTHALSAPVT